MAADASEHLLDVTFTRAVAPVLFGSVVRREAVTALRLNATDSLAMRLYATGAMCRGTPTCTMQFRPFGIGTGVSVCSHLDFHRLNHLYAPVARAYQE
jgi:hypothetical protein